jgi:hypothetical protein
MVIGQLRRSLSEREESAIRRMSHCPQPLDLVLEPSDLVTEVVDDLGVGQNDGVSVDARIVGRLTLVADVVSLPFV